MLNEERCCSSGGARDSRPGASDISSAAPGYVQIIGHCTPGVALEKTILLGRSYSAALPGRWEIGFPDPGLHSQAHLPPANFYCPSRGQSSAPTWLALSGVLLAAGFGVWFFERNRNPDQFCGKSLQGLGNGFWWSAVTMTTVGYGDRAPITLGGRFIALVWMFTSSILISGFTATLASSLTVQSMGDSIKSPADLPRYRIAALKGSTSEGELAPAWTVERARGELIVVEERIGKLPATPPEGSSDQRLSASLERRMALLTEYVQTGAMPDQLKEIRSGLPDRKANAEK